MILWILWEIVIYYSNFIFSFTLWRSFPLKKEIPIGFLIIDFNVSTFITVLLLQKLTYMWAKTSVENANQMAVPSCFDIEPWNSLFVGCLMIHTTKPINRKKPQVVVQRSVERGFKKIHMFLFPHLTNISTPRSEKGNVKSRYKDLFDVIVASPTTAS